MIHRHTFICLFAFASAPIASHAMLEARDLDGNALTVEAYYDTTLDVTWMADWHYQKTSGSNVTGGDQWANAITWLANLDYYGVRGWRLPDIRPANGMDFEYNFSNNASTDVGYAPRGAGWGAASELGHLLYVTLNNDGFCLSSDTNPTGCQFSPRFIAGQLPNTGPFINTNYTAGFWLGQPYLAEPGHAWLLASESLLQGGFAAGELFGVIGVRDGDVSPIPEPNPGLLLLVGMGALATLKRFTASKVDSRPHTTS